jgi:hypothetical protein
VLGVNLVHGAFLRRASITDLIDSLMDELSRERIDIDMIKLTGRTFASMDHRLLSLQLVERGLTDAAMFRANGEVVQPSEVLYKKPILVERGSFRPATKLTLDLLTRALDQFLQEPSVEGQKPVVLAEMTLRSLSANQSLDREIFSRSGGNPRGPRFRRSHLAVRALLPIGRVPGRLHRRPHRARGWVVGGSTSGGGREVFHGPARWRA